MGDPRRASVTGKFQVVDLCSRKVCDDLKVTLRLPQVIGFPTSWVELMEENVSLSSRLGFFTES
jgi:hypothetical protein